MWHHAKILPHGTIPTDAHYVRTKFQQFVSDQPHSSFEKLVVSTPRLIRDLHTMSQAKATLDVLQDRECEKTAVRKPLRFQMYQKQRYGATSSCLALCPKRRAGIQTYRLYRRKKDVSIVDMIDEKIMMIK